MLIDSHCHLDDYENIPAILANAKAVGVQQLLAIGIGNGPADMHVALDIANAHPDVFATAGIHPQEAHQATPENLAKLATLAQDPRCIAIGEIGLDYYHLDNPDIPTQHAAFVAQLKIAVAAHKPITIHCRTSELAIPAAKAKYEPADAWVDLLALLAEHWIPHQLPGIMHCFSGNEAQAASSLAAGFYLSFAGHPDRRPDRPRQPHPRRNRRSLPHSHPPPRPAQRTRQRSPHRTLPRRPPRHLTRSSSRTHHQQLPPALPFNPSRNFAPLAPFAFKAFAFPATAA